MGAFRNIEKGASRVADGGSDPGKHPLQTPHLPLLYHLAPKALWNAADCFHSQASMDPDLGWQAWGLPKKLLPITVLAQRWQDVAENAATVSTVCGQIQNPLL